MFHLDVMLKFWELLFALGAALFIAIGTVVVYAGVKRRRTRLAFYIEAGGVTLSMGEEYLLQAIAGARPRDQNLSVIARTLSVNETAVYSVARALIVKDLISESVNLDGGSPQFELTAAGNMAALARGYLKLL